MTRGSESMTLHGGSMTLHGGSMTLHGGVVAGKLFHRQEKRETVGRVCEEVRPSDAYRGRAVLPGSWPHRASFGRTSSQTLSESRVVGWASRPRDHRADAVL